MNSLSGKLDRLTELFLASKLDRLTYELPMARKLDRLTYELPLARKLDRLTNELPLARKIYIQYEFLPCKEVD